MPLTDDPPTTVPAVSVILPTYNRARFLRRAFAAIAGQALGDWELIVVDDGSDDGTASLVRELAAPLRQPLRYVYQENAGPYSARNVGLDMANGRYVAFYDSDDVWLPHHLSACVAALEADPLIDWVYGAVRRVDDATGRVLTPHSFYDGDRPRPFLRLKTRRAGALRRIDDPRLAAWSIEHGLFCGLQNSVIRARVFDGLRFEASHRNEAEDQVVVTRAAKAGATFGYFEDIHLIYAVHDANSSAAARSIGLDRRVRVIRDQIGGYERFAEAAGRSLAPGERRALRRRLGRDYFWVLGYALLWEHDRRREALSMFRKGLALWPWNPAFWKTYLISLARAALT